MKPCKFCATPFASPSLSSGRRFLMLVFGFGITTDVEHIRYATFDLDQTAESRAYLEQFAATPRYFTETAPVRSAEDGLKRLQSDDISLVIEMPPNFGRDLRKGLRPEVLAQVDGANTYRGETVSQYVQYVQATMTAAIRRTDCRPSLRNTPPPFRTATCTTRHLKAST